MPRIIRITPLLDPPLSAQPLEIVERKGLGHPDTICDAVAEEAAVALARAYRAHFGRIVHFNVDKGLLIAGQSEVRLGGGRVVVPLELILGGRATRQLDGITVPVEEIVTAAAARWFRTHFRFLDPARDARLRCQFGTGSPQLTLVVGDALPRANDTSAAVGYYPPTDTERLVLALEAYINSPAFKQRFPESGEDVKIMAVRQEHRLTLTVAMAFVDRFILSERQYFERKAEIARDLLTFAESQAGRLPEIALVLNALDQPGTGLSGMYLTVTGTSAEEGDDGQVGRGNRANGLIAVTRPASAEAAPGKNAISHVGKIYNALAFDLARALCERVPGVAEAYVWLCSLIGDPVDEPRLVQVQVRPAPGAALADLVAPARALVEERLDTLAEFLERLTLGEVRTF